MPKYQHFIKTHRELELIGLRVSRCFCEENPSEVDIDLTIEKKYGFTIDVIPLRADKGVEAWCSISKKFLYVDIELADNPRHEGRYRMTLAEELAHSLLHSKIYNGVETYEQWATRWDEVDDTVHERLDKNAKELAGIILMPQNEFFDAMLNVRDFYREKAGMNGVLTPEQENHITGQVVRKLTDDFNVNDEPCRIRIDRLTEKKGLFGI